MPGYSAMMILSRSTACEQDVEVAVGELDADRIAGREQIRLEGQRDRARHLADDLAPALEQLGRADIAVLGAEELDVDLAEVGRIAARRRCGHGSVAAAGRVLTDGGRDVADHRRRAVRAALVVVARPIERRRPRSASRTASVCSTGVP